MAIHGWATANASFLAPGAAGRLVFELAVEDGLGNVALDQVVVTVAEPLLIHWVSDGLTVKLSSNRPGYAHEWTSDGLASTEAAPVHAFSGPGSYDVQLTVAGPQGPETAHATIDVAVPQERSVPAAPLAGAQAETSSSSLAPLFLLAAAAAAFALTCVFLFRRKKRGKGPEPTP